MRDKFNGWKALMEKIYLMFNMDKIMVMVTCKETSIRKVPVYKLW